MWCCTCLVAAWATGRDYNAELLCCHLNEGVFFRFSIANDDDLPDGWELNL